MNVCYAFFPVFLSVIAYSISNVVIGDRERGCPIHFGRLARFCEKSSTIRTRAKANFSSGLSASLAF